MVSPAHPAPTSWPPPAFHLMTKPTGAICNLDCEYCYFLSKEMLYPGSRFRMAHEVLESYIKQYIEAQPGAEVVFAWQGGEPTLMGLEFFKLAVHLQHKHVPPHMRISNTLQTNGTLLDDEWAAFFKANNFLIGLSVDGPEALHNAYRVDKGGNPTFARVMRGLDYLKKHHVDFNILTTVHAANAEHPRDIYHFLKDEVGTQFIQFIPIVERDNDTGYQEGTHVTARSITAAQYGRFLTDIFEHWVRHDVGRVYVQLFDVALGKWLGSPGGLCIFDKTCGAALALEHTGDVYSCDHYVEPDHLLGNLMELPLAHIVASDKRRAFGLAKVQDLPRYCQTCEVRFACNGGCPKNRFIHTPQKEPGLNYLCAGYKAFFNHIDPYMRFMATALKQRQPPAAIMAFLAQHSPDKPYTRNSLCFCGSQNKYKHCCGKQRLA